jgi:hypothetical protein
MVPKLAGALEIGQSITKNQYGIDIINTLRFWHRYLSIPEIRYFCQACFRRTPALDQSSVEQWGNVLRSGLSSHLRE